MKKDSVGVFAKELRRGNLILAVLAGLRIQRYGYQLQQFLAARGLLIQEATLYPLLKRLQGQGYLQSEWRIDDDRPKRFYQLTPEGKQILEEMLSVARNISSSVEAIYKEEGDADS
jgi:DNA-binding PadR family transcriptional regulator